MRDEKTMTKVQQLSNNMLQFYKQRMKGLESAKEVKEEWIRGMKKEEGEENKKRSGSQNFKICKQKDNRREKEGFQRLSKAETFKEKHKILSLKIK